jgi:FixJ family two-component response regulator
MFAQEGAGEERGFVTESASCILVTSIIDLFEVALTSNERSSEQSVVFIVDDDDALRAAVGRLVRSIGLKVVLLASAREFLAQKLPNVPCCLVLDVRLPGLGGLDFQVELAKANIRTPIIFLTAYGDIPMTVKAMKAGAVEFLTKPFRDQDLIDAIQLALERDQTRREEDSVVLVLRSKFETLSPREQEVMAYVTSGLLNKQIASEIGITENTVKLHRGNVMEKMGARSLAELVRMADVLGVHGPKA